jgi:hypothetical protein
MGKMQQIEKLVYVGKNRFELLDDNILFVTIEGEVDKETAIKCRDLSLKFFEIANGQMKSLVDLTRATKQPPESRRIVQEMWNDQSRGKVALFGLNPVSRVVASFVIGSTGQKDLKFFKTKDEALAWLNE